MDRLWVTCSPDEGWILFRDGSLYYYYATGTRQAFIDIVNASVLGTFFNYSVRQPAGGMYVRGSSVRSDATLLYAYPPYRQQPNLPAHSVGELTWELGLSDFGSSFSGSGGVVTLNDEPAGFFTIGAELNATPLCVDVPTTFNLSWSTVSAMEWSINDGTHTIANYLSFPSPGSTTYTVGGGTVLFQVNVYNTTVPSSISVIIT